MTTKLTAAWNSALSRDIVKKALVIFDVDIWLDNMAGLNQSKYLENRQKIPWKSFAVTEDDSQLLHLIGSG